MMDFKNIIQLMQAGQNPEQFFMNYIQQTLGNTPMGANLLNLTQSHDQASLEKIARNLCAQKGLDFDKEFTAFKQNLGL